MHKNLQLTIAWFVLASLLTAAAVWQAMVTVEHEASARRQQLPPPTKTRHAVRPPQAPNPPLDFATRQRQGLTDAQIGWIIEDFQAAGLDLEVRVATKEAYLAQRKVQDRWYREALAEAWALTPQQAAQVSGRLSELYDQAKADFIEALAVGQQPIEVNGQWFSLTAADPIHRLIHAAYRFEDPNSPFMPWNLCELTATHPEVDQHSLEEGVVIESAPEQSVFRMMSRLVPRTSAGDEHAHAAEAAASILTKLRKLHPAQLKLWLLINPGKAREIRLALDAPR